jgi:hypothetical protein
MLTKLDEGRLTLLCGACHVELPGSQSLDMHPGSYIFQSSPVELLPADPGSRPPRAAPPLALLFAAMRCLILILTSTSPLLSLLLELLQPPVVVLPLLLQVNS